MTKKKTTKKKATRRVGMSPVLGAPYTGEGQHTFVTDCPKCSRVYTTDDINGGRCTGCGTAIDDVYARAWSTMKNGAKTLEMAELKAENERLKRHVDDLLSGKYINCVYCGHRYGPTGKTPATQATLLYEHIKQCEKHPLCALQKKFDKLEKFVVDTYDILYFESEENDYNPNKEWDSAADFIEMIAENLDLIIHRPEEGAKTRPEFIK